MQPLPRPNRLLLIALSYSIDCLWVRSKYARIAWKIIKKFEFAVQTKMFRKNCFLPYQHLFFKILLLVENPCEVVIYTKKLGSAGQLWSLENILKNGDLCSIYRVFELKVNSNTALTRCCSKDLRVWPLNCILLFQQHDRNFILGTLVVFSS